MAWKLAALASLIVCLGLYCGPNETLSVKRAEVYFKNWSILTPIDQSADEIRSFNIACMITDSSFLNSLIKREIKALEQLDEDLYGEPAIVVDLTWADDKKSELILNPSYSKYRGRYYMPNFDLMNSFFEYCDKVYRIVRYEDGRIMYTIDQNEK